MRRQHILEAAIRVFAERGFQRTTIRDVAAAAGVSDGTIYNSFENKAALLRGVLDPLQGVVAGGAPPSPPPVDAASFFQNLLTRRWTSFTPENLAMLRVVLSEALVDPDLRALVLDRLIQPVLTLPEPLVRALVASGQLATPDAALALRTMTATVLGLVMLNLLGEERVEQDWDLLPGFVSELLLAGLRGPCWDADVTV